MSMCVYVYVYVCVLCDFTSGKHQVLLRMLAVQQPEENRMLNPPQMSRPSCYL